MDRAGASLTRWPKREGFGQTVDLVLEHVLLDTPNLSQVLTVFNNAAKAAGIKLPRKPSLNMLHDSLNRLKS
jgi:hypothetical protein